MRKTLEKTKLIASLPNIWTSTPQNCQGIKNKESWKKTVYRLEDPKEI